MATLQPTLLGGASPVGFWPEFEEALLTCISASLAGFALHYNARRAVGCAYQCIKRLKRASQCSWQQSVLESHRKTGGGDRL